MSTSAEGSTAEFLPRATPLELPQKTKTLSFRLVAIFVALMSLVVAFTGTITMAILQHFLTDTLDDELISSGQVVATQIVTDIGQPQPSNLNIADYYLYTEFWDSQSQSFHKQEVVSATTEKAYGKPSDAVDLLSLVNHSPQTVAGTKHSQWRVVVFQVTDPTQNTTTGSILIARPMDNITETVARVTKQLLIVGVTLVVVGGAITAGLVKRELKPLRSIEKVTHAIAAGELSQRVNQGTEGSEIGILANSINMMLSQIEQAFAVRISSETKMRQFVSDASHELRTPLATVRGYAELYRIGGVPAQELPQTMDRIESEATRMTGLVEDLLQLARLDEGRPLHLHQINLTQIAYDAVADFHVRDTSRTAHVVGLNGDTPEDAYVLADRDKVTQVVSNLLSNVLTHTPPGTPCEVAVGWNSENEAVVEIRDHGPGVSEKDAERLFERFYRADFSRSRASGGSGLGMAIVAAIMASHGGTARVSTTEGGGLTVALTFPAPPEEETGKTKKK